MTLDTWDEELGLALDSPPAKEPPYNRICRISQEPHVSGKSLSLAGERIERVKKKEGKKNYPIKHSLLNTEEKGETVIISR